MAKLGWSKLGRIQVSQNHGQNMAQDWSVENMVGDWSVQNMAKDWMVEIMVKNWLMKIKA
jgi:hypothetical protein